MIYARKSWGGAGFLTVMIACFGFVSDGQAQEALLTGKVLDARGAVVFGATIVLRDSSGTLTTHSSDNMGEYNFKTRPGVYEIELLPFKGFGRIRRGPFRLDRAVISVMNFQLYSRFAVIERYESDPSYMYDDIPMGEIRFEDLVVSSSGLRYGVISYGEKSVGSNSVRYSLRTFPGPSPLESIPRPMFTYDLFSITADTIEIECSSRIITARGNVMIEENGILAQRTGSLRVSIENDRPVYLK